METYKEFYEIPPCTLNQDSLLRFEKVIRSGFPDHYIFQYKAEYNNTSLVGESIGGLINHESVPSVLKELTLSCYQTSQDGNFESKASVYISLSSFFPSVQVQGNSQVWTKGKIKQIAEFFEAYTKTSQFINKFFYNKYTISIVFGFWMVASQLVLSRLSILYSLLYSISTLFVLLNYLSNYIFNNRSRVRIILSKRRPLFLGMEPKDYLPLLVSVVSIIISLLKMF